MTNMAEQVTTLDSFVRTLCTNRMLPRRIRSIVARRLIGLEQECGSRDFEVPFFEKKYFGNIQSHIDWHVFFFGCYDPLGLNLLRHVANRIEDAVALDVGANAGNHMLLLSQCCSQVHCFEPYPRILPQLERNITQNQLTNVSLHKFGLSDHTAVAQYFENEGQNLGAGSFESSHTNTKDQPSFELQIYNADEALSEIGIKRFDLMKIDVEGHEISVLRGMRKSIDASRPVIFMEHGPTTHNHVNSEQEFRSLFPEDYKMYRLAHRNRWTRESPCLMPFQYTDNCNILLIADEKRALAEELIVQ